MEQASSLRYAQDLERFCARVEPPGPVVDVQPGQGAYTQAFLGRGYDVLAFSGSMPAAEAATGASLKVIGSAVDETLIGHRTVAGVWLADSMQYMDMRQASDRLRLFADWLKPSGVCSFVLREGEGVKRVLEHGAATQVEKTLVSYQPHDVEALVQSAGLRTLDAWRQGASDRMFIHVLAQRPQL